MFGIITNLITVFLITALTITLAYILYFYIVVGEKSTSTSRRRRIHQEAEHLAIKKELRDPLVDCVMKRHLPKNYPVTKILRMKPDMIDNIKGAFPLFSGTIFVGTSLLRLCEDQSTLAFHLAYELSHLLAKDNEELLL